MLTDEIRDRKITWETTVRELLPGAFGPGDLQPG